jgi:hypothetical protein
MSNVLLTAGRGTFPLALARRFHAAGHRVFVADNWPRPLSRYSSTVERCFRVPAPAQAPREWIETLVRISDQQKIDFVVPIYEEIFYLAESAAAFPEHTRLFAADFETLITLHSKWKFNQQARQLGLAVPDTQLLNSRAELLLAFANRDGRDLVFKPVYSRFATFTLIRPQSEAELKAADPTPQRPWVAQEFLTGRPLSTFTVAHQGRITAHAAYAAEFSLGMGPTLAYRPLEHPAAFQWVSELIEKFGFTGQMGVDFIEQPSGEIAAIECNPRLTGGAYLLKDDPKFVAAYLNPSTQLIVPDPHRAYVFRLAMSFNLLKHSAHFPGVKEWAKVFFFGRSTNEWMWSDPLPTFMNPLLAYFFVNRCIIERKTGQELVTADFAWSDEPQQSERPEPAPVTVAAPQ